MFKEIDYNKHFVIGCPLVGWKVDLNEHYQWLEERKNIIEKFPNAVFFTALELDERKLDVFESTINKLKDVGGDFWTYTINDKEDTVTSVNRLIRIETGRNLIRDFSQRKRSMKKNYWGEDCSVENDTLNNIEAILYVDSDVYLTVEIIEKLFEIDHPLVGIGISAYGLSGDKVINENPRIEEHWNSAGLLLVNAPAYYDLLWGHNAYLNLSDDPTFQSIAERLKMRVGVENLEETYGMTWVRKDIEAYHPNAIEVERKNIRKRTDTI